MPVDDPERDPETAQPTRRESAGHGKAPRHGETDVTATDDDGEPTASRGRGIRLFIRDVLLILVAAVVISFLIKTFLFRSFYIPSESMESTLLVNDRVIVNQLTPELMPIQHGDVVVFTDPGGWLTPTPEPERSALEETVDTVLGVIGITAPDSNDHLVKRVIGMPGDHIECCGEFGQVSVNGIPLEEPYIQLANPDDAASPTEFDVTVPEGYLWVMGDNRYHSGDSAYKHQNDPGREFVPIDNVVGRAVIINWPVDRWTFLDNYPVVFAGVTGDEQASE